MDVPNDQRLYEHDRREEESDSLKRVADHAGGHSDEPQRVADELRE